MQKTGVLLAGLMALFSAFYLNADPLLQKGTKDLALAGSPDFTAPSGDTVSLDFGLGLFIRDNLSLRVTLLHEIQEDIAPGNADYRATEYNLVSEYHFDPGWLFIPYVGVELGWRRSKFGSIRDSGAIYGPRAGIKYFLADNVAIDVVISYKTSTDDVYISDFKSENNKIAFGFGLRIMF